MANGNGTSNGVNAAQNIGPLVGKFAPVGPVIQTTGGDYSSPYIRPETNPRYLNSPSRPVYTGDRHPWRNLPRNFLTDPAGYGCSTCGLGQEESAGKSVLTWALVIGGGYLLYKALVGTWQPGVRGASR